MAGPVVLPALLRLQPDSLPTVFATRWGALRQHPLDPEVVCLTLASEAVALLPHRVACHLRATALRALLHGAGQGLRATEGDVAAGVAALLAVLPPALSHAPPAFRGDHHVFMPWDHHFEDPFLRPASLPAKAGPLPPFHPATSAYASVSRFGAPLSAAAHESLLASHPHGPLLANCIRVGFPMLAHVPPAPRRAPNYGTDPSVAQLWEEAVGKELVDGNLLDVTANAPRPLRFCPYFGVPKDNGAKVRPVADLSWGAPGAPSVNDATRRGGAPRARLAQWKTVIRRIRWMRKQRPGVPILLAKLDASNAFRQCPLAERDVFATAHRVGGKVVVNTRLIMGAVASVDFMSLSPSAIQDAAAEQGIFLQSYVDDQLLVAYADCMDSELSWVKQLWGALGWSLNATKFETEGLPALCLRFLGIDISTSNLSLSVPLDRLQRIHGAVASHLTTLQQGRQPPVHDLKSLAGRLNFFSTLIPTSRAFLRSLYRGGDGLREDLTWWHTALPHLNGTTSFADPPANTPTLAVSTDAAKQGWGVVCPSDRTFAAGVWSAVERAGSSTAHWEAAAVMYAVGQHGPGLRNGVLHVYTDSTASVAALGRGRARDARMSLILRACALLQVRHGCQLILHHIPGKRNVFADRASRCGHPAPGALSPPSAPPWRCMPLALSTVRLGELLAHRSATCPSTAPSPTTLPSTTGLGTLQKLDTPLPLPFTWTLWSAMRMEAPGAVDFSIFADGCSQIAA